MLDRWYIAGPMTGWRQHNYPAFMQGEQLVSDLGRFIFNPARENMKEGYDGWADAPRTWQEYMQRDRGFMLMADVLVLLPLWSTSEGARDEYDVYAHVDKQYRLFVSIDDSLQHIACASIERTG